MARRRKEKDSNVIKIDFTGIQSGPKVLPEDDYAIKIQDVTKETSDNTGQDYLKWVFAVADGKHKGAVLYQNTSLQPQALWNLRSVLEAFEIDVPDGVMELDLDELKSTETVATATVEDDTYDGKKRSRIVDIFSGKPSGDGGSGEKDAAAGAGDDDLPTDDDIDDMDEDDLKEVVKEYELDVNLKKLKKIKDQREAVKEAMEEKRSAGGGDADKPSEDEVDEMDEDELGAVIKNFKLDVDLDDFKTIKKKRAAVWEALEAEDAGDTAGETYTEDAINEMDEDELEKVNDEADLGVDLDKEKKIKDKRKLILKALKKADKLADD